MNRSCATFQEWMLRAALHDLEPENLLRLQEHLLICPACAANEQQTGDFLELLHSAREAPLPRHYAVSPPPRRDWRSTLAGLLVSLRWMRMPALAAAAMLFGFWLGRFPNPFGGSAERPLSASEWQKMRSDMLQQMAEQNRQEHIAWQTAWRKELQLTLAGLSAQQQQATRTALERLENRLDQRILAATFAQQQNSSANMTQIVDALQAQRQDMYLLNQRLNRVAVRGEARSQQTDALLNHILEISDQRLQSVP